MESRPNSPEFGSSSRPTSTESVPGTEKKRSDNADDEKKQKLGSILLGGKTSERTSEAGKIKKEAEKKPKKKDEKEPKAIKDVPQAEMPAEPEEPPEPLSSAKVINLVERLKAIRREQVIIAEIEAAQPEVVRARSLARQIMAKLRREHPAAERRDDPNWRDIMMPEQQSVNANVHKLDQAVRQGEQADQKLQAATRERRLHLVSPLEEDAGILPPVRLVSRWRSVMFPALAAGTGAVIVSGGGAAARTAEIANPTAAMMASETFIPRVERFTSRAETSAALVGAGALFIAGLWVGRRRGERRAERDFVKEREDMQQKLEQQETELRAARETTPEVILPPQPAKIEHILRQEIVAQQQITAEQEERLEKLQTTIVPPSPVPVSATLEIAPVAARSVAEFAIPTASREESVARPAQRRERTAELGAPVVTPRPEMAPSSIHARPEVVASARQPESEPVVMPQMTEYEMKPIIIQRLERITGNRRSAEHVYELLKASHSSPAEVLALTPEKLKAKASDAMKRDAARLVLGRTLRTVSDETIDEAPPTDTHLLMHELQKPPAMSLREFLAQPSKQRDRALMVTIGIVGVVVAAYFIFA